LYYSIVGYVGFAILLPPAEHISPLLSCVIFCSRELWLTVA